MVALQIFYEDRAGERLITKPAKSLVKPWTSINSTKSSFPLSKANRIVVPLHDGSVSTPPSPEGPDVAIVAWPSSASINISATHVLPPLPYGSPDPAVGKMEVFQDIADAYHDPDVLDVRKTPLISDLTQSLFDGDYAAMNPLSSICSPGRKTHVVPTHRNMSGTTVLNASMRSPNISTPRSPFKNETTLSDFIIRTRLGAGANGIVYRVDEKITNKTMALKVIRRRGAALCDLQQFRVELDALKRLVGDRHCMQVEAGFQDEQFLYLALAFYSGGDLHGLIRTYPCRVLPVDRARCYTAELLVGVHHLHCQGIIHRDLKPSNVLVDSRGHLVIADLGLAKVFTLDDSKSFSPYNPTGTYASLSQDPYLARSLCGTAEYMAPEVMSGAKYGFAVDFWAVGVMLYEMLKGRTPWATADGLHIPDGILGFEPLFDSDLYPNARDLLHKMLQKDVDRRPLYEVMLQDPFFVSIDWKKIEKRTLPALRVPFIEEQDPPFKDPILLSKYEPSNDPLPNFNFISPTLKRQRRHAQALGRIKSKSGIQGLQKIAGKLFFRRPSAEKREQHASRRACRATVSMLVGDNDMRVNWASGAAGISHASSNWSFRHFLRRDPFFGEDVHRPPCNDCYSRVPLRRFESFIFGVDQGERPRPTPKKLRGIITPTPSPTNTSPAATLVASLVHQSPSGIDSPSRSPGLKRWINRLLHPIPSAQVVIGDERKTLDLTA